jgi:uncharacterized alkaline shock family protein YloU
MAQQTTTDLRPANGHSLVTGQGRTSIADSVVAKIAGVAAREVSGVHEMGRGAARAFGTIKDRLPVGGAPNVTQGVKVEVGERQAAIDIDLVVEYGVSIPDVSQAVRDNVIQRVERMTGLEVTEVNISVDDVYLGDDSAEEPPRVQ